MTDRRTAPLADPLTAARHALAHGRFAAAHAGALSVLRNDGSVVEAIAIKARAEWALGHIAAAEASLRHAIATAPQNVAVRNDLARLLSATGRTGEAEAALREVLILAPDDREAHAMLGMRLSEREALVAGAWHLRRAMALGDAHPLLLSSLGHNLLRQGELPEAERLLDQASAALPDVYAPHGYLAATLERQDRPDEALAVLTRAKPAAVRVSYDTRVQEAMILARTERWRDALTLLEHAPALNGTGLLERGRLRDRAGRHDDAWADFVAGKARLSQETGFVYSRAEVDAHIARLADFFTAPRLADLPRAPRRREVPQPLFILGFPRSGTTLTEQLLTSHSRIRAGGELPFTGELIEFAVSQIGAFPDGLAGLAAADRRHVVTLFRDFYLARAEEYGLLAEGADYFTDKTPLNEMYLPLLRMAFPDAPMIAVQRHPLDVLVSVMSHTLTHGFNCGFRIEDAAHHLAAVARLLEQWQALGAGALPFSYERLVADQARETTRLMAHVGLSVEPAQHAFHTSRRFAATPSYAAVREPLYDRSIGRWRHYAAALAPAVPEVAEAIAHGGYDLAAVTAAIPAPE